MSDVPLGFGVTAKSTADCRSADPNAIVVFHQVGRRGGGRLPPWEAMGSARRAGLPRPALP